MPRLMEGPFEPLAQIGFQGGNGELASAGDLLIFMPMVCLQHLKIAGLQPLGVDGHTQPQVNRCFDHVT